MDRSVTIFHTNCRLKWNCYHCPVCFHIKNPQVLKNSVCMKCDTKHSLWFCIICGHVGCGWGVKSHALEHFEETSHEYVMGLSKFDVFNYKTQQYMHEINGDMKKLDSCLLCNQSDIQNNCPCIVCQHNLSPKLLKQAVCMICEICDAKNLWICLNCRHIGCGRYKNRHALQHFKEANHPHVMQMENFGIWDYKEAKYRHNHLNVPLEFNECDNQVIKENFAVAKIKDSLKVAPHSEAAAVSKESFSPQSELSIAAKLLKLQPEYIIKRIDLLERQWQEFGNLAEANKKMIVIEQRLVQLTVEKKNLEQKLHEHDIKLSELITQFAGDYKYYSGKKYVNGMKIATMEPSNSSHSPAVKTGSSPKTNIISLFILGLFIYYFLKLSLQKIFEIFMNLF